MKILAIRGENLASLESFDLALEEGPLAESGIFAITGPTGAGKTTLLDALCVALFDKTPRLSGSAGVPVGQAGEDESLRVRANDVRGILRRGAGEGFAEVDFIGRDDKSYRARWHVRRARLSAKGKLQAANLSLEDLQSGEVIEGKKGETLKAIESKLGLNFEQFRRSALLAQNDFAAFLKADKDERSALLERMTGTEVYTKISVSAFQKAKNAAEKLRLLTANASQVELLTEDKRLALQSQKDELKKDEERLSASIRGWQMALRWAKDRVQAKESLQESQTEFSRLDEEWKQSHHKKQELLAVQQAKQELAVVERARASGEMLTQAKAEKDLSLANEQKSQLLLATAKEKLAAIESGRVEAKEEIRRKLEAEEKGGIKQCNELRQWLASHEELKREAGQSEALHKLSISELDQLSPKTRKLLQEAKAKLVEQEGELERALQTLASLEEKSQAVAEAYEASGIGELRRESEELLEQIQLSEELAGLAKELSASVEESLLATEEIEAANSLVDRLTHGREEAHEKISLASAKLSESQQAYDRIRAALNFEEERAHLQKDEHCPLCGSQEHPWASEKTVVNSLLAEQEKVVASRREESAALESADEASRLKIAQCLDTQAKLQEKIAEKHKERERRLQAFFSSAGALYQKQGGPKQGSQDGIAGAGQEADFSQSEKAHWKLVADLFAWRSQGLSSEPSLLSLALTDLQGRHMQAKLLANEAKERREKIAVSLQKGVLLEQELDVARKAWQTQAKEVEILRAKQVTSAAKAEEARQEHSACQRLRYTLREAQLQDLHFATQRISEKLESIEQVPVLEWDAKLRDGEKAVQEAEKKLAAANARTKSSDEAILRGQAGLAEADRELEELLERLDCSWSELGVRLSLSDEDLEAGLARLRSLREARQEAKVRLDERKERDNALENEGREANLLDWQSWPKHSLQDTKLQKSEGLEASGEYLSEELESHEAIAAGEVEITFLEGQRALKIQELIECSGLLKADSDARKFLKKAGKELEESKERARVFQILSDLIGSADGKKFRVFAQSLTLDSLIENANYHLEDLSPRYQLQRVPGFDLDLQVVDRDLGDEVRSVNSLSGGESFLMSLALALGLSSLSAKDVRVESLLVDEGFGSLDEESLESALAALDSLQATGRKIGLISHVPGFAERIGTQVRVLPKGGGCSRVSVENFFH